MNVTEPSCCGIGGDAFCLFFDANTKEVKALNGSGRSPKKLDIEYARSRGVKGRNIPDTDLNSVTVPGAAAAWVDTVEAFGSGKVTVADVLAPAIRLAEEGCVVLNSPCLECTNLTSFTFSESLFPNSTVLRYELLLQFDCMWLMNMWILVAKI